MTLDDNLIPPQRVHRPSLRQLLTVMLVTGFALILCPSAIVLALSEDSIRIVFVIMVFVAQLMLYFLFVSSRIRVITSADGIEYHQLGFRVKSTWEDVDSIHSVKHGVSQQEGLILTNSSVERSWLHRLFARRPSADRNTRQHFIPFTPLMRNWRKEALGRDIQQYAPHLFTAELMEKKQREDEGRQQLDGESRATEI